MLAVELKPYLEKLIVSLVETYASEGSSISAVSRLEEVQLDAQRAVLAGLMLSELISNATKYAFSGREKGELRIVLDRVGGRVELSVSDDGPGLPAGFDPATSGNMGFYLLRMLSDQMRAELVVTSPPGGGVTVALRFDP